MTFLTENITANRTSRCILIFSAWYYLYIS